MAVRIAMSRTVAVVCLCTAIASAQDAPPPDEGNRAGVLEGLVGKWIDLNGEIAEESRHWDEQREWLKTRIDLLEKERDALQEQVAKVTATASTRQKERAELAVRKQSMESSLHAMEVSASKAEAHARAWLARVPESLSAGLEEAAARMPANDKDAADVPVSRRLQVAVSFYSQLEELQNGVHVTREIIDTEAGGPRELDVLYLGLARGYAVSGDDRFAAVGAPGSGGWQWVALPQAASAVRQAIQVHERSVAATLVPLPLVMAAPAATEESP